MCITIKTVDSMYHDYLMKRNAFKICDSTIDGYLDTRSKEELEKIVKHAKQNHKTELLHKAEKLLSDMQRLTSV